MSYLAHKWLLFKLLLLLLPLLLDVFLNLFFIISSNSSTGITVII